MPVLSSLLPLLRLVALDANGAPMGGALLYTYAAGGTTNLATYSDAALTVQNANPVVANSAGVFGPIYLTSAAYRFDLKSAAGVTYYTQDNVSNGLPISGGTLLGDLLFTDALYDIGKSGATRPRDVFLSRDLTVGRTTTLGGDLLFTDALYDIGKSGATRPRDGFFSRNLVGSSLGTSITTLTGVGTVNDQPVATGVLRCNNASLLTITGFVAGVDGQLLRVISVGAGQVDFAHQNTGSAAANRLINIATSGNTSLAAGVGIADFQYDLTTARWRLIQHDQGAWITRTFAAGNFTGNASMTWTVTSGQTSRDAYWLKGRTLFYGVVVVGSTIGGTPSTALQIAMPGGFTGVAFLQRQPATLINNNVGSVGMASAGFNATLIQIFLDAVGTTAWTASANTGVETMMPLEVA